MNHKTRPHSAIFHLPNLNSSEEARLIKTLELLPGNQAFSIDSEKKHLHLHDDQAIDRQKFSDYLLSQGYAVGSAEPSSVKSVHDTGASSNEPSSLNLRISGMTCHSCEVLIERSWKKLPGVKNVQVNAGTGKASIETDGHKITLHDLQSAVDNTQYKIRWDNNSSQSDNSETSTRPSIGQLIILFMLVFVVATLFSKLGLIKTNFSISAGLGLGAALVIGLIASTSSCLAINGGLLLGSAASYNQQRGNPTGLIRMRPVFLFVVGRLASYGLLGGALGLIGKNLTPSPLITALITIVAAVYMLTMGLEMLKIAPAWLKSIMPGMPKSLSHKILDNQEKSHPLMPLLLGGATFFLPCGFTQSLQLFALTTGSFTTSALTLFAFALGTAPMLLALGFAGNSLKGKAGKFFYQFSGALVVVLGLWNMQNGLAIAGYPIKLPSFSKPIAAQTTPTTPAPAKNDGSEQVVKMTVGYSGYEPDNFTVKVGVPVRWEVDGTDAGGCGQVLVSRQIGVQQVLNTGINVINFTPKEVGEIAFSCSMGMYRGSFTVVN